MASSHNHGQAGYPHGGSQQPHGNPFHGYAAPEEAGSDASFAPVTERRDTYQSEGSVAELIPTQPYDAESYEGTYNDGKYAYSAESAGGGAPRGFGPGPGSYAPSGISSPYTDYPGTATGSRGGGKSIAAWRLQGTERSRIVGPLLCCVREGSVKKKSSRLNSSKGWHPAGLGLKLRLPRIKPQAAAVAIRVQVASALHTQ